MATHPSGNINPATAAVDHDLSVADLLTHFDRLPAYADLVDQINSRQAPLTIGLMRHARPPVLARLISEAQVPVLFITGKTEAVPIWRQELQTWLGTSKEILRFAEPTPLPYDRAPWSDNSRLSRMTVLTRLMAGQHPLMPADPHPPVILSSARALLQQTLPKRSFIKHTRILRVGQLLDWTKLEETWRNIGYEQVTVVEKPGQFSQRGGIVDIFPAGGAEFPIRIELFGDEIDTMRWFDPTTQRTVTDLAVPPKLLIPAAREAIPADARELGQALAFDAPPKDDNLPSWQDDIEPLSNGELLPHEEFYLPLIYQRPDSLLHYLPQGALLIVDDWVTLQEAVSELHQQAAKLEGEQISLPSAYPNPLFVWQEIEPLLRQHHAIILGHDVREEDRTSQVPPTELAASFQPGPRYGGQTTPLMYQLKHAEQTGEIVVVVSRQADRLKTLWRQERGDSYGLAAIREESADQPSNIHFINSSLSEGFILEQADKILLNVLTDAEIFGWNRPAPRRYVRRTTAAPETYFSDLSAGNYIVHAEYGIGRFLGLVVRSIGGADREYLKVEYANNDILYVPVHHADRMSKWVGSEDFAPRLNRLGDKQWTKAKQKAQRDIDQLADELLELYAVRETVSGHAFPPDTAWQFELEAGFPYQETEDQTHAIAEVKADMERPQPMDRLICGDVGYGKTEVALRAAFKAVMDGRQVAMLVPTTVLAQQHYQTFSERLGPYPIKVAMLSRFLTRGQQDQVIQQLKNGEVDIVIGTHRLFSNDVSFKDLGLLVIDEEQRFGVSHKERLKQMRTEVDVLTMTATPIPRTMHMALSGLRDISMISTPPSERLPVQTYVGEIDQQLMRRAILQELERGGQIFFVHNRVQTIPTVKKIIENLVPEAIVAIGHGQMNERELESVMADFVGGKVDILLSTTIIESGLDIPNANTLIVDRADMFGLSQLYQLRGRVGRGTRRANAYFFHAPWRNLTPEARARLEAIGEATDLGAGYTIAMRDLEIRGAGELLGPNQSGHIAAIGFDLYTRMLARAIQVRKAAKEGETIEMELPDTTLIDLPLATYLPPDYIFDAPLRLRLYRRMATLTTLDDIDAMAAELTDRFGPIPDPVENLLYQLRVKVLALNAGVSSVATEARQIKINLPDIHYLNRMKLQHAVGRIGRVSRTGIWLAHDQGTREWQVALVQVLERVAIFRRRK
ncbi:MAG: transcription-repair coupling factor [Ardenticatenaceae bacterium]|nr:transcription-repair coupling factor [Ardenticatenaceae bacterium]